ncbi:MAG TPA: hypothetical protein VKD91_11185 [Pyrinomonadaceae bacterium]|nr:hypothetical protein [Pyrinomonadaceae bacterium]
MNKRPLSITIISWLFIVMGSLALISGFVPNSHTTVAQRVADVPSHWYVHLSRIVEIVGGVFMLSGRNWARWLMVAWLVFHVYVGALHSPVQLILHSLLFIVGIFFLFRRPAADYFRGSEGA